MRTNFQAAARELQFPLCLKVISADVVHKSESGGIKLDLRDLDALIAAYRELLTA